MTCEEFITRLQALGRGESPGQEARDHAESCEACAETLTRSGHVDALLRLLARSDDGLEAPARIEETVLGAFRLAHGTANVVSMQPHAVAPAVAPRRFAYRWMGAAAAIAVASAASLVAWQSFRSSDLLPQPPVEQGAPAPERTPSPPFASRPGAAPSVRPGDGSYQGAAPGRGNARAPIIPVSTVRKPVRPVTSAPSPSADEPAEFVTDFYSLVPASGFAPTEGGQLVRLQVPRASLASLGVPIPVGNPNGSVTADLVMGYDGVAHAIRFVQPTRSSERSSR